MSDLFPLPHRPNLPLQGLTVLAVEDSRFASDALRLMCQRSGARLRRAESIAAARGHLRVYRPDVILVDLGLPDGRGDALIRSISLGPQPRPVILGMSGDEDGRGAALAAGAMGFLTKPVPSLATFQRALLDHLPDRFLHAASTEACALTPDPLALRDDLARAAEIIAAGPSPQQKQYLAGFVGGIAHSLHDAVLARAAAQVNDGQGLAHLAGVLNTRLSQGGSAQAI